MSETTLKNTYKSRIKESKLTDNMYLAIVDNFTDATDTIIKGLDKQYIQFYFCTKGQLTFNFNHGNYKIGLNEGQNFLFYNPNIELPLNLNVHAQSKVVILVISIQKLHEIFAQYNIQNEFINASQLPQKYYKQQNFGINLKNILHQIENNPINGHFENMYLLSKAFELLSVYFYETEESKKESCPYLDNEKNAKKLKEVKEILLESLNNPPSLKELTQRTNLSEYHLKEGFKQVYGTTVYGFVLDTKLETAKRKLGNKDFKVKDIAFEAGYENPSHFIAAFKKKFGITPKQFSLNESTE